MKMCIFSRFCPLDLYGNTYILHGGTPQDLHEHTFISKGYSLDLYGNMHILQGVTLRICMKRHVFPMGHPPSMPPPAHPPPSLNIHKMPTSSPLPNPYVHFTLAQITEFQPKCVQHLATSSPHCSSVCFQYVSICFQYFSINLQGFSRPFFSLKPALFINLF